MADIPLTRGQFLLPFVSILDDIGAPTETLLERSRLPSSLAEKSDLYLPLLPALRFVETAQRTQGIEDFGFLAARRLAFLPFEGKGTGPDRAFTDAARRAPARLPLGVAGRHHSEHVDRT